MGFLSVLSMAHSWASDQLRPGDIAIDATVGTGADTAFLCRQVGRTGTVYGFDIQREALAMAETRLAKQLPEKLPQLYWFERSHAEMAEAVQPQHHGKVGAVMFNLGYLPGGRADLITRPDSTIPALDAALSLLRPHGVVTAVLYPGHPGGREEAEAVERWAEALPEASFQAVMYRFTNRTNHPPYAVAVQKRSV